jgi:hypothetical protein
MPESGMTFFSPASNDGVFTQLITSPFYPSFKRSDQGELKVSFNNGYVFDYSNADKLIDPISIEAEEFALSESDEKYFVVELTINKLTGAVKSGTIVPKGTEPFEDDNEFKHLPITTTSTFSHNQGIDVHTFNNVPASEDDPTSNIYFKWLIRLADFKGETIKELYLRDNLHINFTKIRQCGSSSSSSEIPIIVEEQFGTAGGLKPENPKKLGEGNGVLSIAALSQETLVSVTENLIQIERDPENGVIKINADGTSLRAAIVQVAADLAAHIADG